MTKKGNIGNDVPFDRIDALTEQEGEYEDQPHIAQLQT